MSSREEIDGIMSQVQALSPAQRIDLAYKILNEASRSALAPPPRHTLEKARGMLRTDAPPPTDEEVERWIEEHRMSKYGQR